MDLARLSSVVATSLLLAPPVSHAACQTSSSPHKLSISVVDAGTRNPLLGSQVLVSSRHLSFIVPESGVVSFDLSSPVRDTIVVRRLGYYPVVMEVSLKPSQSTAARKTPVAASPRPISSA